jgi:hypothetical protein
MAVRTWRPLREAAAAAPRTQRPAAGARFRLRVGVAAALTAAEWNWLPGPSHLSRATNYHRNGPGMMWA